MEHHHLNKTLSGMKEKSECHYVKISALIKFVYIPNNELLGLRYTSVLHKAVLLGMI